PRVDRRCAEDLLVEPARAVLILDDEQVCEARVEVDVRVRVGSQWRKRRIQLRLGEICESIDVVRQPGECKRLGELVFRPTGGERRPPGCLVDSPDTARYGSDNGQ